MWHVTIVNERGCSRMVSLAEFAYLLDEERGITPWAHEEEPVEEEPVEGDSKKAVFPGGKV